MNIPNAISFFRLLLVPVFALVYFSGGDNSSLWAFGVFLVAGISDILDGYIARKYNMVTSLGRIIDPLADKLMVFTALVCTAIDGKIHPIFPILFFIKEGYQIYGAARLAGKISDVVPANIWGKSATFLFYVAITLVTVFPQDLGSSLAFLALCIALALSIIAFFTYYKIGKELIKDAGVDEKKHS